MVVADLHVHTTASDGTLDLERLPAAARRADVSVVAVTDHDRPHPALDTPVTTRSGLTVVHGVELRVDAGDQRVDLLGYGLDPTAEFDALVERIQSNRRDRGRAIVDCVEDRLGVSLDVDPGPGFGRPHVARAVADSAAPHDYQDAFDRLVGTDCPCYVARDVPSFETGRAVLSDACRLVGLAHPLRYGDPAAALALTRDLDAVERYYPYDRTVDQAPVERAVDEHDLVATGGSDAHEETLGLAGLDAATAGPFRERLGI